MRTMMHAVVPVDIGNAAIKDGSLGVVIQETIERLQPEAAYFLTDGQGRRSCYLVFDMADASEIPAIAEPLFQKLHASVKFRPVMNAEDLQNGLAAWMANGG